MPTYRYEGNRRGGDATAVLRFGEKTVELGGEIELTQEEFDGAKQGFVLTPVQGGFATGGIVPPVAAPTVAVPEPSEESTDEPAVEADEVDASKSGSRSTLNVKPSHDDESLGRGL